jgi:SAM-dependent methyltransferase
MVAASLEPVRERLKLVGRALAPRLLPLVFAGDRVLCPCCGGRFRAFVPERGRPNARCPGCLSLERHRVLWLYLTRSDLLSSASSILHFAPELRLRNNLRKVAGVRYVTADLSRTSIAEVRADITDIQFEDQTFDMVICNHVLEHVLDDRRAMSELRRVLKPGGLALMQHPVDQTLERTFEDPSVTSPRERHQLFGQRDHVRVYGRDFTDRLREAGFRVTVSDLFGELDSASISRHGLADEPIWICRRPTAS